MSFAADFDDQQRSFTRSIEEAQSRLERESPGESIASTLDHIREVISDQQRRLNEASAALPAHSVRTYQAAIDQARASVQDFAARIQPKKKFAFKSRGTAVKSQAEIARIQGPLVSEVAAAAPSDVPETQQAVDDRPGSLTITSDCTGSLTKIDTTTHPVLLQASIIVVRALSNVCIDLRRPARYASVTLSDLQGCTVHTGDAESSLFISNCSACKIEGEAQQIRIHTTHDCDIRYVCRAARPVIENCSDLRFLNTGSVRAAEDTMVDDFSDLSGSGKNWSVLTP